MENLNLSNTRDQSGTETIKPQRKVVFSTVAMVAMVVLIAVLNAVTPEMLEPLGSWGSLVYAAVVALAGALTAYGTKNGPVR